METIDEEITAGALAWMEKQAKAEKPFFLWYNSTAMHFRTHLAKKNRGKSGQGDYSDRMATHDEQVGELLAKLDACLLSAERWASLTTPSRPPTDPTTPAEARYAGRQAASRAVVAGVAFSAGRAKSRLSPIERILPLTTCPSRV